MAASTLAGQKPNPLLLGAATRSDLIASVNCGARSRRKRKTKWKHSETSDTLINKCGKYDSDDDVSFLVVISFQISNIFIVNS